MTAFGESVGFLKLSREAAGVLGELLEQKVQQGEVEIEHEQVYPELFQRVPVGFERMEGLAWTEIDTPEDLQRAEQEILPRWATSTNLNRRLASLFLPWVARLPATPNQWTALSLISGAIALNFIAQGYFISGVWGAFFFQLFYLIDHWDGEVARQKGLSSKGGAWFDVGVDALIQVGLPLALAKGLLRQGAAPWVQTLGWMAAGGVAIDFAITSWAKVKGFGPAVFGDPSRGGGVPGPAGLGRFIQINLTHENFSLMVAAVLLFNGREPFLLALAIGSQLFWIIYLWRERNRLFGYNFAQARR
jgi:phosphatidylglycerophosphate synthase